MNFKSCVCLVIIWTLTIGNLSLCYAYRPFGVDDAWVAGKGIPQTEISFDYYKWGNGKIENILLYVPIYGITDDLELSAEIPYLIHKLPDGTINRGIGDINLVFKYLLFCEGEKKPALSLKGVYKLDTGDFAAGLGSGDKDYSIFALISKTINNISLNAQLGYGLIGKNKNPNLRNIPYYGVEIDWCVSKSLALGLELNGNRHSDSAQTDDPKVFLFGVIYKLSDKISLDCASRWGLSNSSPVWSSTAGASIAF